MDVKKYFEEAFLKLEKMSDQELEVLLIESGIEDCPFEEEYSFNLMFDDVNATAKVNYSYKKGKFSTCTYDNIKAA